jgi:glycosyltransferase involved in cell wall biosynthesis
MYSTTSTAQSLTVVVPIYNESEAIKNYLPELIEAGQVDGWRIVLVDDGSTDDSAVLLDTFRKYPHVDIVKHKINRGYGSAIKSGMLHTTTSHIVTIDGDGQHHISDIAKVYNYAIEKNADLVVGDRGRQKVAGQTRQFGKWLIRSFTRILMTMPIHDLNSGFKLYRTDLACKYLPLCPNTMAFSDVITLAFIHQRHLVLEYPISVRERQTGKSTIGVHTAVDTILEIINLALLFNPLRIFISLSAFCILVGLGWGIPIILLGRGVSVGSMLAIVTGLILFVLGLLASQLSAMRISMLENRNRRDQVKDDD